MSRGVALRSARTLFGPYTLAALIWRAGQRCTWCARTVTLETYCIDHVVPRARGGALRDPSNVVLACRACNLQRYAVHEIPLRAALHGRTLEVCMAEVARQMAIPVGRATVANREARSLAFAWFGADIEARLRVARAAKLRRARGGDIDFPFGALAPAPAEAA